MASESQFGGANEQKEQQYIQGQPSVSKHNYGFTLAKIGTVGLMTAEARMIYHFSIPQPYEIDMVSTLNCSRFSTPSGRGQCMQIWHIARRFHQMIERGSEYLKRKLDAVHDILIDLPITRNRRKRGFLTDILGKATGLATKDEVYKLVSILRKVESGVQKSAEAWRVGSSHFLSSYKIMNNQIDNINNLLRLQRTSITEIYEDIKVRLIAEARFKLLNEKTIDDLSRLMFQISETDLLFVAIQQLISGQLPHFLIPQEDLQRGIDHFKEFLQIQYPNLKLYSEDPHYYYKNVRFNVVQLRNYYYETRTRSTNRQKDRQTDRQRMNTN